MFCSVALLVLRPQGFFLLLGKLGVDGLHHLVGLGQALDGIEPELERHAVALFLCVGLFHGSRRDLAGDGRKVHGLFDQGGDTPQVIPVYDGKTVQDGAVDHQHPDHFFVGTQRKDHFAVRCGVSRNIIRVVMHIRDIDHVVLFGRKGTDALPDRDAGDRRFALEGPEEQAFVIGKIKTDPVHPRNIRHDLGSGIGKHREKTGFLLGIILYVFFYLSKINHCNHSTP